VLKDRASSAYYRFSVTGGVLGVEPV